MPNLALVLPYIAEVAALGDGDDREVRDLQVIIWLKIPRNIGPVERGETGISPPRSRPGLGNRRPGYSGFALEHRLAGPGLALE